MLELHGSAWNCKWNRMELQFALHYFIIYNSKIYLSPSWKIPCARSLESKLCWPETPSPATPCLYLTWLESPSMPTELLCVAPPCSQLSRETRARALPVRGRLLPQAVPAAEDTASHEGSHPLDPPLSPLAGICYQWGLKWGQAKMLYLNLQRYTCQVLLSGTAWIFRIAEEHYMCGCKGPVIQCLFLLHIFLQHLHCSMIICIPFSLPLTWVA